MDYELAIIGGGPGGVAAGVYAARKKLKTILITEEWGGQSTVSTDIQNWIGTVAVSGGDFAKMLKGHLEAYAADSVLIKEMTRVERIVEVPGGFQIETNRKETHTARAVLITTGSNRRKLMVPGAEALDQKGLTYCASCDGPLFSGTDVAVVGGGNAAFETAAQLLAYTKSVTLLQHSGGFKADPVTVEKVLAHPNMRAICNAETTEIVGDKFVSGLKYLDKTTNETKELAVEGIFVEIGLIPNTQFAEGLVKMNALKQIEIDPWTQATSTEGVWAAGDCTNIVYHQNNISAGDAVKALEDIYLYLRAK